MALSLGKYLRQSHIWATDLSPDTLSLEKEKTTLNMIRNVTFRDSDWFSKVSGAVDLTVSNPPYLTEEEWA
jgi:release factor glutamine methyltransferase